VEVKNFVELAIKIANGQKGSIVKQGKKLEQKLYINKLIDQIPLKQLSSKILIPQRRFHGRQIITYK